MARSWKVRMDFLSRCYAYSSMLCKTYITCTATVGSIMYICYIYHIKIFNLHCVLLSLDFIIIVTLQFCKILFYCSGLEK